MSKYKISVVTGTRAEYGLLRNIISLLSKDESVDFRLIVTGTHLCKDYGETVNEILSDGFNVSAKIPCVQDRNDDVGMVMSAAEAMKGFAAYFEKDRPDMLILLGDRYEIFACAAAAAMLRIPIAHLYGGDTTEGAIDEFFRHSITKMSYLHFVSNEDSRRRVIQLGEEPARVYNLGATGAENIVGMDLLDRDAISRAIGVDLSGEYALVTYHPVTLEDDSPDAQMRELFSAMEQFPELTYIFTKSNADANGKKINLIIDEYARNHSNVFAFESLGIIKYLSAMKYARFVIGNSSSGIYEAPLFGIPTVNIGDRQRGRLQANTIINSGPEAASIRRAISEALKASRKENISSPYYKEGTSSKIVETIKNNLEEGSVNLKKRFFNIYDK
jgi:GDP/UDP-N,N'-diacetylbacillosamine 2-epimerase (hydrolysing)